MSDLLKKLQENSTIKESEVFSKSKFFNDKKTKTGLPILNIALSGDLDGGFGSGVFIIAGKSRHFKSNLGLLMVASYLNQYDDAVCQFYDNEYGSPPDYMKAFGIDLSRVHHSPIEDIEQLKIDMYQQLEKIKRGDHIIIFVDSIGAIASTKEMDDAKDAKIKVDMSRPKALKSLFRIITPKVKTRNIPCIFINHTRVTMDLYAKEIVSGGEGPVLASQFVFIITRKQEKDGDELDGYKFMININKSRFVREGMKFPFIVTYDHGIQKWSGLIDFAVKTGHIKKHTGGWYTRKNIKDDEKRKLKDTNNAKFWQPILEKTDFREQVKKMVSLEGKTMLGEDDD